MNKGKSNTMDNSDDVLDDESADLFMDDTLYPVSVEVGEADADKLTYSAHRLNKNFYMPAEPAAIAFIGPRGSGKTTAMLAMSEELDYDTLAVFSPSSKQPKIAALKALAESLEEEAGEELPIVVTSDLSYVVSGDYLETRDPSMHHVVLLDDFLGADEAAQSKAFKSLVMNGRPANVTALLSTQSFTGLDKKIRDNLTHMCFFRGVTPYDLKRIARDYLGGVLTPDEFVSMYSAAMKQEGRPFLMYDKMTDIKELQFRLGFDMLWVKSGALTS